MKTLDDTLLQTATQRLVMEFQPDQIWLYGSHPWGNPHEDSDVDRVKELKTSLENTILSRGRRLYG